jgi:hypothetical protein
MYMNPDLVRGRLLLADSGPAHSIALASPHIGSGPGEFGLSGRQVKPLVPWRRVRIFPSASIATIAAPSATASGAAAMALWIIASSVIAAGAACCCAATLLVPQRTRVSGQAYWFGDGRQTLSPLASASSWEAADCFLVTPMSARVGALTGFRFGTGRPVLIRFAACRLRHRPQLAADPDLCGGDDSGQAVGCISGIMQRRT